MGRTGFFKNRRGYSEVLNREPEIRDICQQAGLHAAQDAFALGGRSASYVVDTRSGATRFHTRVATADRSAYFSERKWHALRNSIPWI